MPLYLTPGERLFIWLLDRYKTQRVGERSWIHQMAREFEMPDLENYLLRSTALMVLRRLMWNAQWYEDRFGSELPVVDIFERDYLLGVFGFGQLDRRRLSNLVFAALRASKTGISPSVYNHFKEVARKMNQRCQIGGCALEYDAENEPNSFCLDHVWPRSLGGSSDEANLRVACRDCNSIRSNVLEAADAHYEHFHVKTNWSSDPRASFWRELHKEFRIAALLMSDSKCQLCETSVDRMENGLDFLPVNRDENYNIFNIQVACGCHRSVKDTP